MKRVSKKIGMGLICLLSAVGFAHAASTTDSLDISITIPGTLTISDDAVPLSISGLTPGTLNSDTENTVTVGSNSDTGFTVDVQMEDLGATAGQLCENNGADHCTANVFDGGGTASYVSFTSEAGTGNLTDLAGATFANSETKLGAGNHQVFTSTGFSNIDSLKVHYNVYADSTIVPTTYEGTLIYTIVAN